MHRIDNASAATSAPTVGAVGPNPNGFWQQGNPGTSTPSTVMDQDFFNAVQEELIAILAAASITPVKGTYTQVLAALRTMFAGFGRQVFTSSGTFTVPDG